MAFRFDPPIRSNVQVKYPRALFMPYPRMRYIRTRNHQHLEGVFGDIKDFVWKTVKKLPQITTGAVTGYVTSGGDWAGAAAGAVAARTRKGEWLKFKVFPSAVVPGAIAGGVVGAAKLATTGAWGNLGSPGSTADTLKNAWGSVSDTAETAFGKAKDFLFGGPGVPQPGVTPGTFVQAAQPGFLQTAGSTLLTGAKSVGGFMLNNPMLTAPLIGAIGGGGGQEVPPEMMMGPPPMMGPPVQQPPPQPEPIFVPVPVQPPPYYDPTFGPPAGYQAPPSYMVPGISIAPIYDEFSIPQEDVEAPMDQQLMPVAAGGGPQFYQRPQDYVSSPAYYGISQVPLRQRYVALEGIPHQNKQMLMKRRPVQRGNYGVYR